MVKDDIPDLLSCRSSARLDLVHEVDNVVLLAHSLQTLEPLVGSVMVPALSLNMRKSYKSD